MGNTWNRKNALWVLLYAVLYVVGTVVVCVLGSVHPIMFVLYQVVAGLLLTGVVATAFDRVQAPGVAACLAAAMILLFFIIGDAVPWHVIPVVVIGVVAEVVRYLGKYSWFSDVAAAVVMSFSTFGYYGQIWFNRAYTYECAVEEMPAGYGDALMALSPAWALPVVVVLGIALSVAVACVTAKLFKLGQR